MAYDENGCLVADEGQLFKQVGWVIQGGPHNKRLVDDIELEGIVKGKIPLGGYSPVYVEIGKD